VVGLHPDGRQKYSPATSFAWENTLWNNYGRDVSGLTWELDDEIQRGGKGARRGAQPEAEVCAAIHEKLLGRLESLLAQAPEDSACLALDYRNVDASYDKLKELGRRKHESMKVRCIYLLLGGAHGFDGKNDSDSSLYESILHRFRHKLGHNRVGIVNLCEDNETAKFTASKVSAFLAVEHSRGVLRHVVAGLEDLKAPSRPPAAPARRAPWASSGGESAKTLKVEVGVQTDPEERPEDEAPASQATETACSGLNSKPPGSDSLDQDAVEERPRAVSVQ
ncbi:unnamed protein product, partial [Polarella glacialis]